MSKLAHSHQPTMDILDARRMVADGDEFINRQATEFAAALLIPEIFIRADLAKIGPRDIDDDRWIAKLCTRYRVSRGLMQFRLRQLAEPA